MPHVHHHSWISHHCTAHSQMQSTSQKTYIALVGKTHTPNLIVRQTHTCRKRNDPFRAVAKDLWWWQAWAAAILFHQSTKIRYKHLFSHCLSDSISFNVFISSQFRSSFQLALPIKHQFYTCSKMPYFLRCVAATFCINSKVIKGVCAPVVAAREKALQ